MQSANSEVVFGTIQEVVGLVEEKCGIEDGFTISEEDINRPVPVFTVSKSNCVDTVKQEAR